MIPLWFVLFVGCSSNNGSKIIAQMGGITDTTSSSDIGSGGTVSSLTSISIPAHQKGLKLVDTGAIQTGHMSQGSSISLSIDKNTVLIGGRSEANEAGAAWVFTRSTDGVWTQQGNKLVPPDSIVNSGFGYSVSLSRDGNTALIGVPYASNYLGDSWIFKRSSNGEWVQPLKLSGVGNPGDNIEYGTSVSLSADGSTALIGGPYDSRALGAAWVFVP